VTILLEELTADKIEIEKEIINQVMSIINNDDQVVGNRAILNPLKLAISSYADIRIILDIVSSDPALAAHLLYRNNLANVALANNKKNRSLKDAVIRIGLVNVYRYAFTYYLKEKFDSLNEPYKTLILKYWDLNEDIALESMIYIRDQNDQGKLLQVDKNELQTLALFSIFGQIIALTAFAYINMNTEVKIPMRMVKAILDKHSRKLSINAFKSLGIDDDLVRDFKIAHGIEKSSNPDSIGLIIQKILIKKKLKMA
jgi:hypothetical protein